MNANGDNVNGKANTNANDNNVNGKGNTNANGDNVNTTEIAQTVDPM